MSGGFTVGERVRVKAWEPPGHVRTPWYTRGHVGEIVAVIGPMPNPEHLAYGRRDRPPVRFYRVAFDAAELWPHGRAGDAVVVDLAEHWLEPPGASP